MAEPGLAILYRHMEAEYWGWQDRNIEGVKVCDTKQLPY